MKRNIITVALLALTILSIANCPSGEQTQEQTASTTSTSSGGSSTTTTCSTGTGVIGTCKVN